MFLAGGEVVLALLEDLLAGVEAALGLRQLALPAQYLGIARGELLVALAEAGLADGECSLPRLDLRQHLVLVGPDLLLRHLQRALALCQGGLLLCELGLGLGALSVNG